MRRLAGVLASVGFTLGLVALPATALAQTASPTTSQGGRLNPLVSGPFTGTANFDFPDPSCPSIHQVFDGAYTAVKNGRTGLFHVDGCVDTSGLEPYSFSGTFTLAAPTKNVATMKGTAAGLIGEPGPGPGEDQSWSITLTPASGTGKFANVGGVVNLTGERVMGPISGSLAGALTR
jgi:hypothetical protein